jgi:hypothetical protein
VCVTKVPVARVVIADVRIALRVERQAREQAHVACRQLGELRRPHATRAEGIFQVPARLVVVADPRVALRVDRDRRVLPGEAGGHVGGLDGERRGGASWRGQATGHENEGCARCCLPAARGRHGCGLQEEREYEIEAQWRVAESLKIPTNSGLGRLS